MKTKQFNLKDALKGAKLVTRAGHEVSGFMERKSFASRSPVMHYNYTGYVNQNGMKAIGTWNAEGRFLFNGESSADLFMVDEKKEDILRIKICRGFVNIYPRGPISKLHSTNSCVFDTREQADNMANIDRVACVYVEWEEEVTEC